MCYFCYKLKIASTNYSQMLCSILFMHFWFLFSSFLRIRTKIVDPYNKILARTAQLARLQVILLLLHLLLSSHICLSLDIPTETFCRTIISSWSCAPSLRGLISMFIGLTSEIETTLPSRLFAVKTDSVIHPACGKKKKCTQTKRKSFCRNRCFLILIWEDHIQKNK